MSDKKKKYIAHRATIEEIQNALGLTSKEIKEVQEVLDEIMLDKKKKNLHPFYPGIAKALRCGRAFAKKLLKMEGGVMSSEEVAKFLNVSLAEVFNLRAKGLLLAVRVRTFPKNPNFMKDAYPRWQFDEKKGKQLKGFRKALRALRHLNDDWSKFLFFFCKARGLKKTPLEELREGNIEGVVLAAQGHGEQGGW